MDGRGEARRVCVDVLLFLVCTARSDRMTGVDIGHRQQPGAY